MHWVAAEATATAAVLHAVTGEESYATWYQTFWDHIDFALRDREGGSWWHELDSANRPSATVWSGKPDTYHALQATLVPRLPVAPSFATALAPGPARPLRLHRGSRLTPRREPRCRPGSPLVTARSLDRPGPHSGGPNGAAVTPCHARSAARST